jgi:signal transduction histidine kinase
MRLPRPTIRLRLTLLYGALFLVSGAALLGVTFLLVGSATANPLVYRGPNGEFSVTFTRPNVVTGIFVGEPPPGDLAFQAPPPGGVSADAPKLQVERLQSLAVQQHAAEQNQLLIWSGVALGVMAIASIGIGWLVAGRVLEPVRTMAADVRQISATNLHRHLALDGPDDELSDLGNTFNDLLGRLERSFDAQRQFVANASHELRTPLARQRTLIQVALDDPNVSLESLRGTVERVLVAGDQQERLIEALFTLARGERGLERHEPVDLADIARDATNALRSEIEGRGLRVETRLASAPTSGDPQLLERLVTNLVDNALRYNLADGRIEIVTATAAQAAVLRVTNTGSVVPADEIGRLFQPFQRLGTDRTRHGDGWGLGLSIVRAIAGAHDGTVVANARSTGGLEIDVRFPRRSP